MKRCLEHPSLARMRESVLPEYNKNRRILELDGFVDKVRELDPKSKLDATWFKHGGRYEVTVSYPHSLGEHGNQTEFVYETKPTVGEIADDLLETLRETQEEINKPLAFGIVAKSGRDERIEEAIDKVWAAGAEDDMRDPIVGRRIVASRLMTQEEMEREGWTGAAPVALVLDSGHVIYPSHDEEGNGPGVLFGRNPVSGECYILLTQRTP